MLKSANHYLNLQQVIILLLVEGLTFSLFKKTKQNPNHTIFGKDTKVKHNKMRHACVSFQYIVHLKLHSTLYTILYVNYISIKLREKNPQEYGECYIIAFCH